MSLTWPHDGNSETKPRHIPASIEVLPKQVIDLKDRPHLFPADTKVYIPDVGNLDTSHQVNAARILRNIGYEPVPHLAARRLTTKAALMENIAALTQEAGVRDVLVIGGGLTKPAGEFNSALAVLETGLFDRFGINRIGVAGHPEGNPEFSDDLAIEFLRQKQAFAERTAAKMRVVTQFGF